ncbi:MAG TPA: succinyl-diaminopimelate desuccinylase [Actinomycetota bacterium]|jgi:succinyl-diaminopimelate desuccinylase|nr:succinyl-diaminopimelate desuccinylase [Actinomycetota bacterium]
MADRLAARTLSLVDVPSVSGHEEGVLDAIRASLPGDLEVLDDADTVLFAVPRRRRAEAPFVVLAGHVDTVPIARNVPGTIGAGTVTGRGAADMKGALAVMLELVQDGAVFEGSCDLGLLFFGREELPFGESALLPLFDRCPAASTPDLAIVMEPTDNTIQVGCLGNLNATVTVTGRAAHSARPWLGDNAIHRAIDALAPLVDLPVRDVTIDGLTFREVVSVTSIQGGTATNVVPDRVEARVNYRYAPGHRPEDAEARLRELLATAPVDVRIDGNAPPAPVTMSNELLTRLRDAGELPLGPKQAWTPVAEFALAGVDAVNFGPGEPEYAHRDDERIEVRSLVRSLDVLRAFLGIGGVGRHDGREELT